ncbi:GNAT family N-acetyltransferase [Candidatus Uabimicrobium amorphum]|uniref:N-acetyltransferase n=1 Tax=Uabimicrobium amorphum TaxID=2596890 RepID=A0A5S9IRT3_UABAM|nr:GNAT family N-acetyltransferase [Candidatus Uabimicrobium amorphum]BBM85515.1 N-acetyltransferase [Candidatus Uabimicrobium amorphum]
MSKAKVSLRPITKTNFQECIALDVKQDQQEMVAKNVQSLALAYVNKNLYPLAIYDIAAQGWENPKLPMVGFVMYEIDAAVGFIARLMIGRDHQGKGYGEAAMCEVIRRLKLYPQVEIIATSYHPQNSAAANLYRKLGFVPWEEEWLKEISEETIVRLKEQI